MLLTCCLLWCRPRDSWISTSTSTSMKNWHLTAVDTHSLTHFDFDIALHCILSHFSFLFIDLHSLTWPANNLLRRLPSLYLVVARPQTSLLILRIPHNDFDTRTSFLPRTSTLTYLLHSSYFDILFDTYIQQRRHFSHTSSTYIHRQLRRASTLTYLFPIHLP